MNRVRSARLWQGLRWLALQTSTRITRSMPLRLRVNIREAAVVVRRMDYERHPIYMYADSWIENDYRLHSCAKEPGTIEWIEWIESRFKPGDVFYDIGANVGAYSLVAFRFLGGDARIYAFEPGFVTFPQLCRNVHINGAGQAVVPLQAALSDRTSISPFHYQNLTTEGALHALGAPIDQYGKRFQPVFTLPTLSYSLNGFVRQFDLPTPNHIKIDVDGTESQILKGSKEVLRGPQLRSLLVEADEEHQHSGDIVGLLEMNGFALHSRRAGNSMYCRSEA